jgi:hypothetical protein
LEDRSHIVEFVDVQVIVWPKILRIDSAILIGDREGGLYRLSGYLAQALVHENIHFCELWHQIFSYLHYMSLLVLKRMVTCIPQIWVEHEDNFVGYNETLKAYRIYILGQHQIEVSRDVTFDQEVAFRGSKESYMEIDNEEKEALKYNGIDLYSLVVHP